jgi:hypothetical protein
MLRVRQSVLGKTELEQGRRNLSALWPRQLTILSWAPPLTIGRQRHVPAGSPRGRSAVANKVTQATIGGAEVMQGEHPAEQLRLRTESGRC